MNLMKLVTDIFTPVTDLISEAIEDKDAANEIKYKIFELQMGAATQAATYQEKLLEAQSTIVTAEAKSDSWLTANWRPLTMLTFLALIVSYWMGYVPENISEEMVKELLGLIKIGLGGYVIGRSAEKVVPAVAKVLKKT